MFPKIEVVPQFYTKFTPSALCLFNRFNFMPLFNHFRKGHWSNQKHNIQLPKKRWRPKSGGGRFANDTRKPAAGSHVQFLAMTTKKKEIPPRFVTTKASEVSEKPTIVYNNNNGEGIKDLRDIIKARRTDSVNDSDSSSSSNSDMLPYSVRTNRARIMQGSAATLKKKNEVAVKQV